MSTSEEEELFIDGNAIRFLSSNWKTKWNLRGKRVAPGNQIPFINWRLESNFLSCNSHQRLVEKFVQLKCRVHWDERWKNIELKKILHFWIHLVKIETSKQQHEYWMERESKRNVTYRMETVAREYLMTWTNDWDLKGGSSKQQRGEECSSRWIFFKKTYFIVPVVRKISKSLASDSQLRARSALARQRNNSKHW